MYFEWLKFEEKVAESLKPTSIINTLHSLDEYSCNSKDNQILIKRKDSNTTEYTLQAYLDNKDIELVIGQKPHKKRYSQVNYMEVEVDVHTRIARKQDSMSTEFIIDFENWYIIKGSDNDSIYIDKSCGMIQKIKMI